MEDKLSALSSQFSAEALADRRSHPGLCGDDLRTGGVYPRPCTLECCRRPGKNPFEEFEGREG